MQEAHKLEVFGLFRGGGSTPLVRDSRFFAPLLQRLSVFLKINAQKSSQQRTYSPLSQESRKTRGGCGQSIDKISQGHMDLKNVWRVGLR